MNDAHPAGVVVRRGLPHDVRTLAVLERTCFGVDAWSEGTVAGEVGSGAVLVADAGSGPLLGYAVLSPGALPGDPADLLRIAVDPDGRRRGTGSLLLAAAVDAARAASGGSLLLEVSAANDTALAFYASHGFALIDVRRRYYRDDSDAHVLRLDLDAGESPP